MTSTGNDEQEIPPISPLLEPTYDDPLRIRAQNQIREFDYGDREDVLAEAEELNSASHSNYPPSSSSIKRSSSTHSNQKNRKRTAALNALSLGLRKHRSKCRLLVIFLILWPILCWTGIVFIFSNHRSLFPGSLKESKSTLFVVAHPDDECLFFAPTIIATIQRAKSHGALLVMSSGNHYGQGSLRRKELLGSCLQLGIREDRCDVLDISQIQDDPITWWPVDKIGKLVNEHIDKWMIDSIVTFDDYGVSGHINHRAVSASVTELAISSYKKSMSTSKTITPSKFPKLYRIKSVFVVRKYLGLFDLPLTFLGFIPSIIFGPSQQINSALESLTYDPKTEQSTSESEKQRRSISTDFEKGLLINGWAGYRTARNAFWSHQSQMVWDRHLYMILSQFMYFNTIERIV
ncbi:hypothetical protein MJO29_006056 [Puccinia striiformis f. sp. tritici]|uniref:N-acetylglucosaminylphosphatidylinositol deacetylase n=1 Tax=Puccinia striiformis f. sp. tritici PST-78 TaxID=1165861 RepID=A0A0L0V2W4_9BASI|nr:hypothetical protein Pst134EA_011267 [Puccinia striiformis f. sp. tritici]KAI9608230.1 hypothetical protein KEM48_003363 [Puccinia striiformis f. sp. tritici PST-130]KNE93329.1 hypothetical protein PSTG_13271 [Puccinia striiformis f. sp. tritici PST-78]KAH9456024.1 hypothetical protein Pst134EB_012244 [Puccinia striiformis f. sp. tritici]KAH9467629.1 hypothetical protein Pst134EA_011267 [Puccinia striiformis f. sp. tritici]KAI7957839.1 hypothetical protein MJO29_006056 [Puccinia striiformis